MGAGQADRAVGVGHGGHDGMLTVNERAVAIEDDEMWLHGHRLAYACLLVHGTICRLRPGGKPTCNCPGLLLIASSKPAAPMQHGSRCAVICVLEP